MVHKEGRNNPITINSNVISTFSVDINLNINNINKVPPSYVRLVMPLAVFSYFLKFDMPGAHVIHAQSDRPKDL